MADVLSLAELPEPDARARRALETRLARVIRPAGALARLDEVAGWLAGWQGTPRPAIEAPRCLLFAADHGVAAAGVSAYPAGVTRAMLEAFLDGAASVSAIGRELGVPVEAVDVGVGEPTGDLRTTPALSPARFAAAAGAGRAAVAAADADLLVLGEMGIGNTTAAAAVCAAIFGGPAEEWVGVGTGVDAAGLARKVAAVDAAVRRIGDAQPLEVLREVGGAELAAIAGAIVEARRRRLPVLLDGYVVTAAAAALEAQATGALAHCLAGHRSPEPGHGVLLAKLGMRPLLDLGMRLGEGSGAMLAVPLVRGAVAASRAATFEERGID